MNRMGQRTEPWGTPEEIVVGWDVNDFSWYSLIDVSETSLGVR